MANEFTNQTSDAVLNQLTDAVTEFYTYQALINAIRLGYRFEKLAAGKGELTTRLRLQLQRDGWMAQPSEAIEALRLAHQKLVDAYLAVETYEAGEALRLPIARAHSAWLKAAFAQ